MSDVTAGFDPGTRRSGLSIAVGKEIVEAHLVVADENKDLYSRALEVGESAADLLRGLRGRAVIEYPMIYQKGSASRVPPDDILILAFQCGAFIMRLRMVAPQMKTKIVRPGQWKGQIDGEILTRRILGFDSSAQLLPEEEQIITAAERVIYAKVKYDHNAVDSGGIVLHALGRF